MNHGIPSLNTEQVKELLTQANGDAVSYIDSPEWFCGERRNTFAMRDGLTYVGAVSVEDGVPEHVCGSRSSLAYSCREKCLEYLDALRTVANCQFEIDEILQPSYNKTKSARRKKDLAQTIRWRQQDIRNATERAEKVKRSYFAGFEKRFLVS